MTFKKSAFRKIYLVQRVPCIGCLVFCSSPVIYLSIDQDALFSYSMKAWSKRLVSSTVNMEVFFLSQLQLILDVQTFLTLKKNFKKWNWQFYQLYFQHLFRANAYKYRNCLFFLPWKYEKNTLKRSVFSFNFRNCGTAKNGPA